MLTLNLKIDHMKYERCVFSQYNLNQPDICVPLAIQESSLAALPSFVSIGGVNCGGERFYPPVGTSSCCLRLLPAFVSGRRDKVAASYLKVLCATHHLHTRLLLVVLSGW